MCGICGMWNLNGAPIDLSLLTRMRDVMSHRGPDGAGCVAISVRGNVGILFEQPDTVAGGFDLGLASRRLSIIDLQTGEQPMANEDDSIWIVFNGEIYYYRELGQELVKRGHRLRTKSDTEIILHAYEEYGPACPAR